MIKISIAKTNFINSKIQYQTKGSKESSKSPKKYIDFTRKQGKTPNKSKQKYIDLNLNQRKNIVDTYSNLGMHNSISAVLMILMISLIIANKRQNMSLMNYMNKCKFC